MSDLKINLDLNSLSEFLISNFTGALDFLQKDIEVYRHNAVFLDSIKDVIKGRNVVVYGSGPTLNYFDPKMITTEDTQQMGVNSQIINEKLKLDFFFAGDYIPLRKNKITPDTLKEKMKEGVRICLTRKYGIKPNNGKFPGRYIPNSFVDELTDCANILYYTNSFKECMERKYTHLLFSSHSIGQIPLQISLLCGASKIYLVGYDQGGSFYADGRLRISYEDNNDANADIEGDSRTKKFVSDDKAIKAFTLIKEMKKQLNLKSEIISVNPVNMKGIFTDVYTNEYAKSKGLSGEEYKIISSI